MIPTVWLKLMAKISIRGSNVLEHGSVDKSSLNMELTEKVLNSLSDMFQE